jgi:hypothetical protein
MSLFLKKIIGPLIVSTSSGNATKLSQDIIDGERDSTGGKSQNKQTLDGPQNVNK